METLFLMYTHWPLPPKLYDTSMHEQRDAVRKRLSEANRKFDAEYAGDSIERQPVHTVYGGAHLFKAETAAKLGSLAQKHLETYASDPAALSASLGLPKRLAVPVYSRVLAKLKSEPVEDYRIDFEDGYGNRSDDEEDHHAVQAAKEVARGMNSPALPPFIGIRIKPFTEALAERSMRTLELFMGTLLTETNGALPSGFVVTLRKVTIPEEVTALVQIFNLLEAEHGLASGTLRIELMIETPQSIIGAEGRIAIPGLMRAAGKRCRGLHFGAYDYTAACNVSAEFQGMQHPCCDFARHAMQVCTAGTGVTLSDGATNILPVGTCKDEVHRAMRLHFDQTHRSLKHGFYQGWDLHPAQLPTRYAAVYSFFLEGLEAASARLRNFVDKAAQATLVGNVFDDAATGQGLLNYFLRAYNCGAITEEEALSSGLSLDELRSRSFLKIVEGRRARAVHS
jgi:citrate lyase beta subunit